MAKVKEAFLSGDGHNAMSVRTQIKGDVLTEEDFRIDGKIDGNVFCNGKIVMGPHAKVIGSIRCYEAELMGELTGNIEVGGTLNLRSTVILNGDVIAKNLEIEPGAVFNGSCVMK